MDLKAWYNRRAGAPTKKQLKPAPMQKSTWKLIQENLIKAIKPDRALLVSGHNDENNQNAVDASYHQTNTDEKFQSVFNDICDSKSDVKEDLSQAPGAKGISKKIIVNHNGDNYMIKPYHPRLSKSTKDYHVGRPLPITGGWGTMAYKGLCNSAGIGHLCEDVGTVSGKLHESAPEGYYTISKFNPGGEMVADATRQGRVAHGNSLDALQLATMDYLTHHFDNHSENLMVVDRDKPSPDGSRLLSVDHDRAFQYDNMWGPRDFMHHKQTGYMPLTLKEHSGVDKENDKRHAQWWMKNRENINFEMNQHVNQIKDPNLRKFIRQNFSERFSLVDDWAHAYDFHKEGLFYDGKVKAPHLKLHELNPHIKNAIDENTPKDNIDGYKFLIEKIPVYGKGVEHTNKYGFETINPYISAAIDKMKDILLSSNKDEIEKIGGMHSTAYDENDMTHVATRHALYDAIEAMEKDPEKHKEQLEALSSEKWQGIINPICERIIRDALAKTGKVAV